MNNSFYAVTIESLDGNNLPVTLRFSAERYVDSFGNDFEVRLKQPAVFRINAYNTTVLSGSRSGFGELELINSDGGLEYLADYALDGRDLVLWLIDGLTPVRILTATVREVQFTESVVLFRLRDPQEAISEPHPQDTYLGNNIPPNGLEGTANDIKGTPKPKVYGNVRSAECVLVNSAKLIYQVSSLPDHSVIAVYDKGVLLTKDVDYASLAELESVDPHPAHFRSYQGYFRLGSSPVGTVTADVDSSFFLLGDVFSQIASEVFYVVKPMDVTEMNLVGAVGIQIKEQTPTADLFDRLAESAGAYWTFDQDLEIIVKLLDEPSFPTYTFFDYEIIQIQRTSLGAGSNGLPIYKVTVQADPVEVVQTEFAGAVDDINRARFSSKYRSSIYEDMMVKTRHLLSTELIIPSVLRNLSDAEMVANRLGMLLGVRRDIVQLDVRLQDLQVIKIGDDVTVVSKKLGYSMGRTMKILGYTLDAKKKKATLNLWG